MSWTDAPEVIVERSVLFGTWVVYVPDGRTIDVCDTEGEAQAAADQFLAQWSRS